MLIIPIKKQKTGEIYNLQISLKNIKKFEKLSNQSEINISGKTVSTTIDNKNMIELIRHYSKKIYNKVYLVSTKTSSTNNKHTTFEIPTPTEYINDELDELYIKVLLDILKNEHPNETGRILDLSKLNIFSDIDENQIQIIKEIATGVEVSKIKKVLENYGISHVYESCEFLTQFEFTQLDSAINERDYLKTIEFLSSIKKINQETKKYSEAVENNTKVLKKINQINKIITGSTLNVIKKEEEKIKVKKNDK